MPQRRRVSITVRGVVQGVGFRPFVYGAARAESLSGWVLNDSEAVRIQVEGNGAAIDRFLDRLRTQPPRQASISSIEVVEDEDGDGPSALPEFRILSSRNESARHPVIPSDLATCPECLAEILDPRQRRYRYPFTNCTNCGPRWSIVRRLPYDRQNTSMAAFAMCAACRAEYEDPADRRFHAQPIACPACGPVLRLLAGDGRLQSEGDAALRQAAAAVRVGRIVALEGLGGFQLLVDATDRDAVRRLRRLKHRPDKPCAVMMADLAAVRRRCVMSDAEEAALTAPSGPILLLRLRTDASAEPDLAPEVAPGNPWLGVMLPNTPLHHLLLGDCDRPLVCTSGNLSEEPMVIDPAEGVSRLGGVAELLLTHDRPIVRPVDDAVMRVGARGTQCLRRARGLAPLPVSIGERLPCILAVGGHLKNAVALSVGSEVVVGSHVGDLDHPWSVDVHRAAIEDLVSFFDASPEAVACDLHPDYASTRQAELLAARWNVPLVRVQHHHAHVAACAAEHRLRGPVLGLAWDGTGAGTDGTVWGGEALWCCGAGFARVAHMRTFPLPGGDAVAREPRRSCLGLLFEVLGTGAADVVRDWFDPGELRTLLQALERPGMFVRSSSLGRVFDGVAALCGLGLRSSHEGQAAMSLEFASDECRDEAYPLPFQEKDPAVADWEPLLRAVLDDRRRGVHVGRIASRFHNALAGLAVETGRCAGGARVVVTGGCFQNAVLTERVSQRLESAGFEVWIPQQLPPGDGGISLGQVWVAAEQLKRLRGADDVPGNPRKGAGDLSAGHAADGAG